MRKGCGQNKAGYWTEQEYQLRLLVYGGTVVPQPLLKKEEIMKTLTELKKLDALLRMTRFSTKRKGNDKKRLSKKLCRKKVVWV